MDTDVIELGATHDLPAVRTGVPRHSRSAPRVIGPTRGTWGAWLSIAALTGAIVGLLPALGMVPTGTSPRHVQPPAPTVAEVVTATTTGTPSSAGDAARPAPATAAPSTTGPRRPAVGATGGAATVTATSTSKGTAPGTTPPAAPPSSDAVTPTEPPRPPGEQETGTGSVPYPG